MRLGPLSHAPQAGSHIDSAEVRCCEQGVVVVGEQGVGLLAADLVAACGFGFGRPSATTDSTMTFGLGMVDVAAPVNDVVGPTRPRLYRAGLRVSVGRSGCALGSLHRRFASWTSPERDILGCRAALSIRPIGLVRSS